MKLSIKQFQFDCNQQILTQDGVIIPLNEKPAQLLTLFLLQANKIHSKSEILTHVWPDRVVTDQVVFQNISYLRTLFGSDAIKTFTKKGYQWQLPITEVVEQVNKNTQVLKSSLISPPPSKAEVQEPILLNVSSNKVSTYTLTLLILIMLALVVSGSYQFLLNPKDQRSPAKKAVLVLPSTSEGTPLEEDPTSALIGNQYLNVQIATDGISNQALFDSPFLTWKAIANNAETLVLATRQMNLNKGRVLRFYIQGKYRGWQGYIIGINQAACMKQLNMLFDVLADSQYFTVNSDNAALAQLALLHNANPNNPLISHQLIKMHFELGYLDRATALANTSLETESNILTRGLLNLLKAKITMNNENWQAAQVSINAAISIFNDLHLLQLESLALIETAWVAYHNNELRISMQALNLSANKAREANEPLQEVRAHLMQSFLASKNNQQELMHTQLDLAKQLIALHHLADEHQIPVLYTLAWGAKNSDEAIQHYLSILNKPFSPLYKNEFYTAADYTRDAYIIKEQWSKAFTILKPWQRNSYVSLSRAKILLAQQNWTEGSQEAINAFRQAQLDYALKDALDAALLLTKYAEHSEVLVNPAEYIDFIKQNANHRWLRQNKLLLEQLAL